MDKGMQTEHATVFTQTGDNNTQVGQVSYNIILPNPMRSAGGVVNANLTLSTEYYNLFVIGYECFDGGHFIVPKDRALTESVTPEIFAEFASLSDDAVEKIKTFPSIFASENYDYVRTDEDHEAYFGVVTDVRIQVNGIKVYFHLISALPQQRLNEIASNLVLGQASMLNELGRTHWAIKRVNLLKVLSDAGLRVLSPGPVREVKNDES